MKYAVISTGGKQYRVSEGDTLEVELLAEEKKVKFTDVLLYVEDGKVEIGKPLLKGLTVEADVLGEVKADKIRVGKYKAKSRYRKVRGHRQKYSQVKITKIAVK